MSASVIRNTVCWTAAAAAAAAARVSERRHCAVRTRASEERAGEHGIWFVVQDEAACCECGAFLKGVARVRAATEKRCGRVFEFQKVRYRRRRRGSHKTVTVAIDQVLCVFVRYA